MAGLSSLKASSGANKEAKRVGRGHASGWGKTGGRGHKGQNSRSGGGVRRGFEGGQMPLYRRSPKWGFNNKNFTTRYNLLNLSDLDTWFKDGDEVSAEVLLERNMIKRKDLGVKVLGNGKLTKSLKITVHKASKSAQKAIEGAKGTLTILDNKKEDAA